VFSFLVGLAAFIYITNNLFPDPTEKEKRRQS
jgi:hypothetical protein